MQYSSSINLLATATVLLIISCTTRPGVRSRELKGLVGESPVFERSFTGFALYDTERGEMVYEYQPNKYFTPASNTKIFTLYAGLKMLGDSIPALQYQIQSDTLIFTGTGDPTFLHPDIQRIDTTYENQVYQFLKNSDRKLVYVERPTTDDYFGPGWAWGDYNYYYSSEKSVFPIYANVVRFQFKENIAKPFPYPRYFNSFVQGFPNANQPSYLRRDRHQNAFYYGAKPDTLAFARDVPFIQSASLVLDLLQDTLKQRVSRLPDYPGEFTDTLYSLPADSVYQRMMQLSDNFIAEQLLLVCSSTQQDTLSSEWTIDYVTENYLSNLPDKPIWVDGSGLSRYNLQTPRSIVALLQKVDEELADERIKTIFPAGGVSGTIEHWYGNPGGAPYVFAKTGTLSNKHALSGFLFTRSGKKLIFSFMHNNYITSSSVLKVEMEQVLRKLYEEY
ncbi:D-alanyl-D-alanine carboxypeptidase/D-alanyl-D-alanine-endopeptidase [Tunicatimonas pelagia]|uniref:D-alanyl-D-alanine carboxypeptidase/D-alanyl-D-alanine-endopeptidase n=1 Tax=Tunicatimonas pelagia TaxID=931531 RepID=UPI002665BDC5|nr:D-alanyl-D-alanine carboxypeptidase [Tunicatimonas pelagia]WKN42817.1 D-alanyl-D-alanine carboxypeptidase [Tunicatimonas pelagia]